MFWRLGESGAVRRDGCCNWLLGNLVLIACLQISRAFLLQRVENHPWQVGGHWYFYRDLAFGVGAAIHHDKDAIAPSFLFKRRRRYQIYLKMFPIRGFLDELEDLIVREVKELFGFLVEEVRGRQDEEESPTACDSQLQVHQNNNPEHPMNEDPINNNPTFQMNQNNNPMSPNQNTPNSLLSALLGPLGIV